MVQFRRFSLLGRSLKEAVADPLPEHTYCLGGSLLCNVTKSLKETVADSTWEQSTIATRNGYVMMCSGYSDVHG